MNNRTEHVYGTDNSASTNAWQSPCLGIAKLIAPMVVAGAGLWLWEQVFELPAVPQAASFSHTIGSAGEQTPLENFSNAVTARAATAVSAVDNPTVKADPNSRPLSRSRIHSRSEILPLEDPRVDDFVLHAEISATLDELYQLLTDRNGQLSAEELAIFNSLLTLLAQQDIAILPVLQEFLASGIDAPLASQPGSPSSLRLALLDLLRRIDNPAVTELALDTLNNTSQPLEVELLAQILEQQAPGQYRTELVQVAHRLLSHNTAGNGAELGPLFQILSEYGGISAAELQQSPRYQKQYAALALALLPDGQGIPALLEQVKKPDAGLNNEQGRLALQLLAQTAADYPAAAQALTAIAKQGLIPDWLWPDIAALASGQEQLQLTRPDSRIVGRHFIYKPEGTQLIFRARSGVPLDADEARARLEVIERLLDTSSDIAAREALEPLAAQLEARVRQIL